MISVLGGGEFASLLFFFWGGACVPELGVQVMSIETSVHPVFINPTTLHSILPLALKPTATSPDFAQRSVKSGPTLA
jgi:hypothetical protein